MAYMPQKPASIVLFKADTGRFIQPCSTQGWHSTCIPVIQTTSRSDLCHSLSSPDLPAHPGLALLQAARAAEPCTGTSSSSDTTRTPLSDAEVDLAGTAPGVIVVLTSAAAAPTLQHWLHGQPSSLPPIAVATLGSAVARQLHDDGSTRVVISGAKNANELADRVIPLCIHSGRALLFLCGNLRKHELPAAAAQAGVQLHELIVYDTTPRPPEDIQAELSAWLDATSHCAVRAALWCSPSGIEATSTCWAAIRAAQVRPCALGETTARACREAGFTDVCVCPSASPGGLSTILEHLITQDALHTSSPP